MNAKAVAGSLIAIAIVSTAVAGIGQPSSTNSVPDILLERLNQGAVIEQYVAQLVGVVRSADRDGDGLDQADIDLLHAQQRAQMRATNISEMLRRDLDGDLKVTRAELMRSASNQEPYRTSQAEAQLIRFDTNDDDVITIQEAAAAEGPKAQDRQLEALLALDPNKDGKLAAEEMRTMAERAFATIDSDGDGKISRDEFAPIAERIGNLRQLRAIPSCSLPAVPAGAKVIAYGGYEGEALSSVAVGGPDQETNLIDVTIEQGSAPLYLVLTSYESMIWRINGATNRVVRVVVTSDQNTAPKPPYGPIPKVVSANSSQNSLTWRRPDPPMMAPAKSGREARELIAARNSSASGVVGISRDKVTIASPSCPRPFYKTDGTQGVASTAIVERAVGKKPDTIFGSYSAKGVSLPSGEISKAGSNPPAAPQGFEPRMWLEAAGYWPAGLVVLDPATVITTASVAKYQVLPSQMGLAQLLGSGAIVRVPSGFRIVRPIPRYPPSMGGAHSVSLRLAKGVPVPAGNPVHSCVISEETENAIASSTRC